MSYVERHVRDMEHMKQEIAKLERKVLAADQMWASILVACPLTGVAVPSYQTLFEHGMQIEEAEGLYLTSESSMWGNVFKVSPGIHAPGTLTAWA
jgi:hypothetical protein